MTLLFFIFGVIVMAHVALRFYAKAHKARQKPRGAIHRPELLSRLVGMYLLICLVSFGERAWGLMPAHLSVSLVGASLYIMAAVMQWRAFKDLHEAYSPEIEVRPEQPLVRNGLYGWVRHPLLASVILELLGVTLVYNAYFSSVLIGLAFVPIVWERLREEEKILREHFGEAYERYAMDVGALFPKRRHAL